MMYSTTTIWIVILSVGAGSFALRFAFLGLFGQIKPTGWIQRHLRYTVVAILPGLVAPLVFLPDAASGQWDIARLVAAGVTLIVGVTARNLMLAILGGIASF